MSRLLDAVESLVCFKELVETFDVLLMKCVHLLLTRVGCQLNLYRTAHCDAENINNDYSGYLSG